MSQVSVTPNISPPQSTYGAPPQAANASLTQSYAPPTDSYSYGQSASGQSPLIQSDSSESASPSANSSAKQNAGFSAANTTMIAVGAGVGAAAAVALPWAIIAGRKKAGSPAEATNKSSKSQNSQKESPTPKEDKGENLEAEKLAAKNAGQQEILKNVQAQARDEHIAELRGKQKELKGDDHQKEITAQRGEGEQEVRDNPHHFNLQLKNAAARDIHFNRLVERRVQEIRSAPQDHGFAPSPENISAKVAEAERNLQGEVQSNPQKFDLAHAPVDSGSADYDAEREKEINRIKTAAGKDGSIYNRMSGHDAYLHAQEAGKKEAHEALKQAGYYVEGSDIHKTILGAQRVLGRNEIQKSKDFESLPEGHNKETVTKRVDDKAAEELVKHHIVPDEKSAYKDKLKVALADKLEEIKKQPAPEGFIKIGSADHTAALKNAREDGQKAVRENPEHFGLILR